MTCPILAIFDTAESLGFTTQCSFPEKSLSSEREREREGVNVAVEGKVSVQAECFVLYC